MKKITLIAVFLALFVSLTAAQPEVTEVNFDSSNPDVGEQVEVTAEAQGYNLDYIEAKMPGESEFESRNCGFTCDNNDDPWTFTPNSAGSYTVEVKAGQILGEESETVERSVTVQGDRDTSMSITGVPDTAEPGQSYVVEAEAYDSQGNLHGEDLELLYRYEKNGDRKEEELTNKYCENDVGLPPVLNACSTQASFEAAGSASNHRIFARIEASDGLIIWRSSSFSVDSSEPDFELKDVSITDEEIEQGESTTFQAEVENNGNTDEYADLEWFAGSERVASKFEQIDAGETETVEIEKDYSELESSGLDVGEDYDISAEESVSGDERDSGQTLTLLAGEEPDDPANFQIEIDDFDEEVEEGETVEVDFTVTNTGDESDSQYVELRARGDRQDREYISFLTGGESESGTLEWDTEQGDSGFRSIYVESEDDEASEVVTVKEKEDDPETRLELRDVSASRYNIGSGESTELRARIANTGDTSENADVDWYADNQRIGQTFRTVPSGITRQASDNVNFNDLKSDGLEEGQCYDLSAEIEYDNGEEDSREASNDLCLEEDDQDEDPSYFDVEIDDFDSEVTEGETVEVDYTVTNTGEEDDIQNIELRARGDRQDRDFNIDLSEGESESGTLRWNTEAGDEGYRSIYVESEDDEASEVVTVRESDDPVTRPDLSLSSVTASDYSIGQGDSTVLRSNILNDGDQSTSFNIRWRAGGVELGRRYSSVSGNDERDSTVQRSFNQLEDRGLSAGNCYNLRARLYSNSELVDTRQASQNLCLEGEDDDDDPVDDPGLYDFSVVVLNDRGSTLEGAEVNVGGDSAVTGSNGVVTFDDIEEGTYDVVASRTGYSTQVRNNVDIDRDRTISMTLSEIDGPEADFTWSPERPLEDQEVVFDAGISSGDIEEYRWDFDDGSTGTGESVSHEFDSSGFYRVNLEVEDEDGRTDDRTRVVQVRAEDEDPEVYDLDVEVLDEEDNDPIENARVSVDGRTRETDDDGRTEFDLDEAVYDVFVSAEGYESSRRWIAMDRDRDLTVELERERDRDRPARRGVRINEVRIPSSVCRGEDVVARVDVENTDTRDRAFTLSATGLGNEIDRSYSIDDGDSSTKTVEFVSVEGSGNEQVSFSTGYDSSERTVQVRDCDDKVSANDISISAKPTQVRIGDSVRVTGYVDDVERGTQVDIYSSNRYRSLGSTTTEPDGRYELYVQPERIGGQSIRAEVNDRQASTRIDVLPTVAVIDANSEPDRVFEGENYEVCAEVESQSSGPLVVLKQDGEQVDSKYGRGEVCFERRSSPGSYDYEIEAWARGQSSSKSTTVEVLEMDSEVRNFPDQIASVESGSGMIKVELYNNQRELRDYRLEVDGVPESWISQSRKEVMLDTGERSTEYFYFTPKEEGDFRPELTVESDGDEIYSEEIRISSGGTDREPSRWDQLMMWLRYR